MNCCLFNLFVNSFAFLAPANEVSGKVMFYTHTHVSHSVHWGVGFPACITDHMTRKGSASRGVGQNPVGIPTRGSASGGLGKPPKIHGLLWDMVNRRAVRILLECFLVDLKFLPISQNAHYTHL